MNPQIQPFYNKAYYAGADVINQEDFYGYDNDEVPAFKTAVINYYKAVYPKDDADEATKEAYKQMSDASIKTYAPVKKCMTY